MFVFERILLWFLRIFRRLWRPPRCRGEHCRRPCDTGYFDEAFWRGLQVRSIQEGYPEWVLSMGILAPGGYDIRCETCGCGRREHGLKVERWTADRIPQGASVIALQEQRDQQARRRHREKIRNQEMGVPDPSDENLSEQPWKQLKFEDIRVGEGEEAVTGKVVELHYVGRLRSTGQVIDSTRNPDGSTDPFKFQLGEWEVIPAWEDGVSGMRVGGRRRLFAPEFMCYGSAPVGGVSHADLIFDVELLSVREKPVARCVIQ
mmetsp:Transcript_4064/g.7823  ORF Transcript_4064/g.7823 Transcript_4064/m.7823 type:complete len:261 (+) Transcript_4064:2140-2922(+)